MHISHFSFTYINMNSHFELEYTYIKLLLNSFQEILYKELSLVNLYKNL